MNNRICWSKIPQLIFLLLLATGVVAPALVKGQGNVHPRPVPGWPLKSPYDQRILEILAKMSLEQKVGQMTQLNLDAVSVGAIYQLQEPHRLDSTKLHEALLRRHVGSLLNCGGHAYDLAHWRELLSTIHRVGAKGSVVPVLYGIDAIHGANYIHEGLLFPQPLAQAAGFDTGLVRRLAQATAYTTRASGIPWNFSPVLDVARQPLWSRFFETYGEDPLVVARMGSACIRGYQGKDPAGVHRVGATLKHFLGYSMPWSGKDRTPAYLPERMVREIFLPPFKAGIEAGALAVMVNSGELNGIPVHADAQILTGLLRQELGFQGLVVSDWEDILKLVTVHRVAEDYREATRMAVMAGVDMAMVPNDYRFTDALLDLATAGEVPMERLDEAVYRILHVKFSLGLMDRKEPFALKEYPLLAGDSLLRLQREAARRAWILLRNNKATLPLAPGSRVLLRGQALEDPYAWNGSWSRTWQGTDTLWDRLNAGPTLKEVMPQRFSMEESNSSAQPRTGPSSKPSAMVVVLAEKPSTEKPGDLESLSLSFEEIQQVQQWCQTHQGPKILVLVQNRPRILHGLDTLFDAVLLANQPGSAGPQALVDLLAGEYSPSGKLPYTYPAAPHSLLTYDHKWTERLDTRFGMEAFRPAFAFGSGQGYWPVRYEEVRLSDTVLQGMEAGLSVEIMLHNTGPMVQRETVLLMVGDSVASVTPSFRRLRDFRSVELAAGERKKIVLKVPVRDLGFVGHDMKYVLEKGWFNATVQQFNLPFRWEP